MKNLIRFIGDGDGVLDTGALHLEHPITDHTLCGETLDSDTETAGRFEIVSGTHVTCKSCKLIIAACKSVRIK